MSIRRVVPDIKSQHLAESRMFYVDFLGFELAMGIAAPIFRLKPEATNTPNNFRGFRLQAEVGRGH